MKGVRVVTPTEDTLSQQRRSMHQCQVQCCCNGLDRKTTKFPSNLRNQKSVTERDVTLAHSHLSFGIIDDDGKRNKADGRTSLYATQRDIKFKKKSFVSYEGYSKTIGDATDLVKGGGY